MLMLVLGSIQVEPIHHGFSVARGTALVFTRKLYGRQMFCP